MPLGQRTPTRHPSRHGARSTNSPVGLPQQLQGSLASCAQSCISSYINQDYTCQDNDLFCLCSSYTSDGYTLGELAYICLRQNCPNATKEEDIHSYNVCTAEPAAVSATHSTLLIPATTLSSTASNFQTSVPTVQTATASSSPSDFSTTASTASSGTSITSVPNPTTHSPTAAASTAPASTPRGSTSLTAAQAVGVSVAALGAVVIIISVVWTFACLRRRKGRKQKEERHSYDFIDEAPLRYSPFKLGHADPRGPSGGFAMPRAELSSEKRKTEWPGQQREMGQYEHPNYDQYPGFNQGSERNTYAPMSTSPESHRSDCSMRTTSQLLPDKPTTMLLRPQLKSPVTVLTPATVFEEERSPQYPNVLLPGLPSHPAVLKRSRQPQNVDQQTKSPENVWQPPLSLNIPKHPQRSDSIQDLGKYPLPPPPVLNQVDSDNRLSERSQANSSNGSLLNYYTSPEIDPTDPCSPTPIEEGMQIRRPPPAAIIIAKAVYPPRAVRASAASDYSNRTSFESNDPDEPTPPEEEEKRLTPVAESPIAGIRYPKIPRSSNQSVPRSPVYKASPRQMFQAEGRKTAHHIQRKEPATSPVTLEQNGARGHTPTLSGSTLAAKRRGDSLAHNLERGLHITHSNHSRTNSSSSQKSDHGNQVHRRQLHRHENPLKGYGRVANSSRREPDWPLVLDLKSETRTQATTIKSPVWEPKLTPRREGDDLYLDLSLATPQHTHFSRRL